ncbi:5852_t:CDS:2 [Funneliformis geosporum]|nr:5852_t:CDS:2 [Funneliformis geosporum]
MEYKFVECNFEVPKKTKKQMSEAWRTLPEEEKTKYQRRYHIERDKLEEDNKSDNLNLFLMKKTSNE